MLHVAIDILDARDYVKVKQAILDKYEIDSEVYHHRFRSMTIMEEQTAKEPSSLALLSGCRFGTPQTHLKGSSLWLLLCAQMLNNTH